MAIKTKDLRAMNNEEREKRVTELKMELIKSKVNASKKGGPKTKDIKRLIARLITLNKK